MARNLSDSGIWLVDSTSALLCQTTGWSWSFYVEDAGKRVWRKVLKHATKAECRREFEAALWGAGNGISTPAPVRTGIASYQGTIHCYIEFPYQQHAMFMPENIMESLVELLAIIRSIGVLPLPAETVHNERLYSDLLTGFASGAGEYMAATGKITLPDFAALWKEEVFVHGDCSIKNFGLTPEGKCCCFDFQWASAGPAGFDTAFFLADVSRSPNVAKLLSGVVPDALSIEMVFACSLIKLGRAKRRKDALEPYIAACVYWHNRVPIEGTYESL